MHIWHYGKDFLNVLNGMFAFALYDRTNQRLILARDRLGIKPLFLAHLAEGVAFASELKALLRLDSDTPEINPAGLIEYIQNQFSSERKTMLQGYERVLPGEAVCIEQGRCQENAGNTGRHRRSNRWKSISTLLEKNSTG